MDIHNLAMSNLLNLIENDYFKKRHKLHPSAFIRSRKLTFTTVVGMILKTVKKSIQIECNWIGDLMDSEPASKQAFSQARQKISPECFKEMHENGLNTYYSRPCKESRWMGFRIIAVDGSTLRLPESPELAKEFGRWPTPEGVNESAPMARISEFTDMTTKLVLNAKIVHCNISEEALATQQLREVVLLMSSLGHINLLFVYDRGYPSAAFIDLHIELGVSYLFRVPKNFNNAITKIYKSKIAESVILAEGWPMLRVSQFTLPGGEDELLLTNLVDHKVYPQEKLSEAYYGRWTAMEEGFKKQKIMMQLENFSGKTEVAIQQEFWATLVVGNLLEMGCIEIEGFWIPGSLPKQHVNRSVIFGSIRDSTMKVIFGLMPLEEYNKKFKAMAKRFMLKVRPKRNYSRAGVGKPKRHHVYRRVC